jgi:hypothetical protein
LKIQTIFYLNTSVKLYNTVVLIGNSGNIRIFSLFPNFNPKLIH